MNRQTFLKSLIGIPIIGTTLLNSEVNTNSDWRVISSKKVWNSSKIEYSLVDVNRYSKTYSRQIDTVSDLNSLNIEKWANDKFNSGKIKLI